MDTTNITQLIEMLPDDYKLKAYATVKQLVREWDPDFTKVTATEAARLEQAETGDWVDDDEIPMPIIADVAVNYAKLYLIFEDGTCVGRRLKDFPLLVNQSPEILAEFEIEGSSVTWSYLNFSVSISDMFD